MQTGAMFVLFSSIITLTILSSCFASPAITLQGCGPEEMGIQSKYRNLCLFYNGLLKQQAYDNFKPDLPLHRFMDANVNDANINGINSDMMFVPAVQESHQYTNGGVKRQDVDHVFLRFGRRR
ncbi:myosuppressin-like [Chrysoperla carnea]|uniref:myosuppressin-like n=1 Tax=Chrysoperla carnea TaxID=189513 RepID=UPI001D06E32D|nr:myosuppressin-like [Chrysoperla carnea]